MSTIYETEEEVQEAIIGAFDQATGRGDFLRTILTMGAGAAALGVGGGLLSGGQVDAASLGLDTRIVHRGGGGGGNAAGVPQSDIDILNYALTLEHLEATFYRNVQPADAPTRQAYRYVQIIAGHEKAHVDTLTAVITQLGGKPVAEAKYAFPKISFPFGVTVENLGVRAYLGAAPLIKTPALLLAAASIVTVEARHAATWAALNTDPDFSQGAFDKGLPASQVVATVTPFFVK